MIKEQCLNIFDIFFKILSALLHCESSVQLSEQPLLFRFLLLMDEQILLEFGDPNIFFQVVLSSD